MARVDIWFDPQCPWTWLTSRWLLEVEQVRDVEVRFHIMSLWLLDGGQTDPDDERAQAAWGPVRLTMATELSMGFQAVRDLYAALGTIIHKERTPIDRDLYALALSRAGLPHSLANAAKTTFYDDAVRSSHRAGMEPVGGVAGCPVIHLDSPTGELVAFFGPVVTPTPRGEAAGRLWDAVELAAATEGFFELKRGRTRRPSFD